jgi:membrane associated rhomboid family serine protease
MNNELFVDNIYYNIKNNLNIKLKRIPITTSIIVILMIICCLYITTLVKIIPCGRDVLSSFYSNFIHIELSHLFVNIYVLYTLSIVEERIGSNKFFKLIITSLIINSIIETFLNKIFNISCSIGFSAIIYSLIVWEFITTNGFDIYLISSLIIMIIIQYLYDHKSSLTGHFSGILTGIFIGFIYLKYKL